MGSLAFHRWTLWAVKTSRLKNADVPRGTVTAEKLLQAKFVSCSRYSLKDASVIITFYVPFVYEVSVWAGRESKRERESVMTYTWISEDNAGRWSFFHLAWEEVSFLLQIPGYLTHSPPGSSHLCLPSHCKRAEMADLHHQVQASHGFWGFKLRPSHLCWKHFICWDTSAQVR